MSVKLGNIIQFLIQVDQGWNHLRRKTFSITDKSFYTQLMELPLHTLSPSISIYSFCYQYTSFCRVSPVSNCANIGNWFSSLTAISRLILMNLDTIIYEYFAPSCVTTIRWFQNLDYQRMLSYFRHYSDIHLI